jgi:uncharacterized iron-regulated membrane protein
MKWFGRTAVTVDQAKRRRWLARWHRRLALFVFLWLGVLAASGMIINHAHDWGLDRSPLPGPLQAWVYGVDNNGEDYCQKVPALGADCAAVFAKLVLTEGSLLLAEHSLFLMDPNGQLVEKLPVAQLGLVALQAVYRTQDRIYLRGPEHTVSTDTGLMASQRLTSSEASQLPEQDWTVRRPSVDPISWERLFLDLHAARFLGPLAKGFNDLVGGLILLLVISGFWLHRQKPRGNGGSRNGRPRRDPDSG